MRATEPCGRATLRSIWGALLFFERLAAQVEGERLSADPILILLHEGHLASAPARADGGTARKQAPRYPVAILASLGRLVIQGDAPRTLRMLAWWKLVQVWACLRFDDHRGLVPARISLGARGLEATLSRSKTTGPDKKVTERPVRVACTAFVVEAAWLRVGWLMWV